LERARRWKERAKNKDNCFVRRVLDISKALPPITEQDPVKQLPQVEERCKAVVETFRSLLPREWVEAYSGPEGNRDNDLGSRAPYVIMGNKLGAGVFGTVYAATSRHGVKLAVKEQVIKFNLGFKLFRDRLLRFVPNYISTCSYYLCGPMIYYYARFYSELNVLMMISGQPRMITTYGGNAVIDGSMARCFIVMARMPTTLADFLKKEGAKMSPVKSLMIASELVEVAEALKAAEISHGDIKVG
jgi:hypothetical protein